MDILKNIKTVSKDTLYYGLGGAVSKFISFFTAPILTRIFTPGDYGMMDLIATTFGFFLMFAGINIVSGIYRYYYEVKTKQEQNILVSTGFWFTILMGFLFLGLMFSLKTPIANYIKIQSGVDRDYTLFLSIVFFRTPFNLIQTYFLSLFRLKREPKKYVVISILQVILNFVLILLLVVYLDLHLKGAFLAGLISIITISIITFFFHRKSIKLKFSKKLFKKVIAYSLPQLPAVFINWGILQVNRFFLFEYSSETELGYFSIAIKVSMVMQIAIMAFRSAWGPFSMQIMQDENHKLMYIKFYRLILIAFTFIAFLVFALSKPVLYFIAPPEYNAAYPLIVFIVFANAFDIAHQIISIGIAINKQTKYISYAQGITFLFVLMFNYILVNKYMAMGAAIALFLAYVVKAIFIYIFAQKLYPIKYDLKNIIHFLVVFTVSIIVSNSIYQLENLYSFWIIFFTSLTIVLYTYFVWLNQKERHMVISYLKKSLKQITF